MKHKLFLFDIDGTLLHVQSDFMKFLISDLVQTFGKDEVILDSESFAGRTDRDIFLRLMQLNEFPEQRFDELKQLYIGHLNQYLTSESVTAIKGVEQAVRFFYDEDYPIGLLTGNFRESAFIKLNRADMDVYFDFGAFGCHHTNRNDLPEIAYEYGRELIGSAFEPSDMIIIGDTHRDIDCAKHFGAVSVAVTTGSYSAEQLKAHQPDLLLDSLENPGKWLRYLA